ncbi:hypothetical protein KRX57_01005 [Weeksellaceae bacterium TAE3-ERU29]|nr:hypothetical protein [Weeksellaceae bacterium TAE3-ERU29]
MKLIKDLYLEHIRSVKENGKDERAVSLNEKLGTDFNPKSKYFLFNGNPKAKTVFVMLNPGTDKDNEMFSTKAFKDKSAKDIVEEIIKSNEEYAITDYDRLDNFDTKQSAFFNDWENTGIDIIKNFWETDKKENPEVWKDAKRNVLKDKLQLELIPYGSRKFAGLFNSQKLADKNVPHILEYVENLFKIITEHERNIVLFGSKQFYYIFKALKKLGWNVDILHNEVKFEIEGLKNKATFSVFEIEYNNKKIKAGIAHTFPNQSLPNAYKQMSLYGKKCFEIYNK